MQKRSRPQQLTLRQSLNAEVLQATVSEGLAQGPYVVTRAGFEPTTLRSKVIDSTNAASCPTYYEADYVSEFNCIVKSSTGDTVVV